MTVLPVRKRTRYGKTIYRAIPGDEYYRDKNGRWLHLDNGKPDRVVHEIEFKITK